MDQGLTRAWLVLRVLMLSSCQAHASLVSIDDAAYKQTWQRNWSQIAQDLQPLAPTSSSPGACNSGGSKQACYDASQRLLGDFQAFSIALAQTKVPAQFADANATLGKAIDDSVVGFRLRMQAIAQSDDAAWARSNDALKNAGALFSQAYAQFPAFDRPLPAPTF